MWAEWHASCQAAGRRLSWLSQADWFPSRLAVVDATLFTRNEWKERHCSSSYPQTL